MKLFQTCYPDYECLGWYRTGSTVESWDSALHLSFKKYNERPLFMLLDPAIDPSHRELPLKVFEETIQVHGEKSSMDFARAKYTIQADEGERITVLHCAKLGNKKEGESEIVPHYSAFQRSIKSLNERIVVLITYLEAVETGQVEADQTILREIKAICHRLPVASAASSAFQIDLKQEMNEALLITYLASITKSVAELSGVNQRFTSQINENKKGEFGKGKRGMGEFMEDRERERERDRDRDRGRGVSHFLGFK